MAYIRMNRYNFFIYQRLTSIIMYKIKKYSFIIVPNAEILLEKDYFFAKIR